jgi:hypothetical protein
MPLGPEDDVHGAFFNQASSVDRIKNVSPALDAAFRLESYQRAQAEKRRLVLEQRRKEEEALLELEERRNILVRKLGDGEGRRELARLDFDTAARAALAVGGAEFLDSRKIRSNRNGTGEWAVKYRLDGRRFECVCDETLHLIDAGICLTSNETGEKGDTFFTLESIPSVIREAIADDKLVVYRHV